MGCDSCRDSAARIAMNRGAAHAAQCDDDARFLAPASFNWQRFVVLLRCTNRSPIECDIWAGSMAIPCLPPLIAYCWTFNIYCWAIVHVNSGLSLCRRSLAVLG